MGKNIYIYATCGATCAPHAEKKKMKGQVALHKRIKVTKKEKKREEERAFRVQTREIGRKRVGEDFW
jgi:hypothetical protein